MFPGAKQALLPKSQKPTYFPVPPPPPRDNTLYSSWKYFGCVFTNLPLWKQDPSRAINWAANTYDCCMTPAYIYDRIVYTMCCCSDSECCNCTSTWCACGGAVAAAFNLPKIPCVALGGTSALISGVIGSVADCVSPQRELIDEPKPLASVTAEIGESKVSLIKDTDDEKNSQNGYVPPIASALEIPELIKQIDSWIKKNDLQAVINFFSGKDSKLDLFKIKLFEHPDLYPKKVFLICLAIRCPEKSINFETRKNFILALLDHEIVNGYNSAEGWISAPLLEATRSNYRYASDLLELLCEYGANIFKQFGPKLSILENPKATNYLLVLVYTSLLENDNYELFYRATLLASYASNMPACVKSFLGKEQNVAYKELHAKVTEDAIPSATRAKRSQILTTVHSLISPETNLSIASLICQYSGLFSPVAFTDEEKFDRFSLVDEKEHLLHEEDTWADLHSENCSAIKTVQQETKIEEEKVQKQKVGLHRYNPLPDYQRLEPAVETETDMTYVAPIFF